MENASRPALDPISRDIWDMKYRFKPADWRRFRADDRGQLAPGGQGHRCRRSIRRTSSTGPKPSTASCRTTGSCPPAGSWPVPAPDRQVTLFNCFVMGRIPDSLDGIFTQLKEAALTMQQGGGIGHDFSTIRPRGRRGEGRGRRCLRAHQLHGSVGCHVQDHHVRRHAARRDDGDHALRPSRHRGLHRGQAAGRAAAQFQSLGAGHRQLHAGGEGGRGLATGLRGPYLSRGARGEAVGPDHAGDL